MKLAVLFLVLSSAALGAARRLTSKDPSMIDALEDIYTATEGANWANNEGWGIRNIDLHKWFGVSASYNQTIHLLSLPSNRLNGKRIPACLPYLIS
jgi:hypothetical protein